MLTVDFHCKPTTQLELVEWPATEELKSYMLLKLQNSATEKTSDGYVYCNEQLTVYMSPAMLERLYATIGQFLQDRDAPPQNAIEDTSEEAKYDTRVITTLGSNDTLSIAPTL